MTLPSPRVMRPLQSTMVTPSTCRVLSFMLTLRTLLAARGRTADVLDQFHFCPCVGRADFHHVHEGSHEKNAASRSLKQVFRRQRVRNTPQVDAFALVATRDNKIFRS